MRRMVRAAMTAGAAAVLTSIAPIADDAPSPQALAMLDPTRLAVASCGSGSGMRTLRTRLQTALLAAPAAAAAPAGVPLYAGLDGLTFPVTANDAAKRYFLQGLMLSYGFNHAGAIASFRSAQRLDPACAACWWGEAVAHGPNINAPMDPAAHQETLAAVAQAQKLRGGASPPEQALIDAVARRYSADPAADRAALDSAYADAMLDVARAFPALDDVAVLAAEAVMDTSPWNYWAADRTTPQPRIAEAVRLVEAVLSRKPDHPQAAHLYIHLMENFREPGRAEAAADQLAKPLAPGAGHLVHMPGHIFYRLGRFSDSIRSNVAAARADEAYIASSGDRGLVRFGYYPHNVHFLVTSAQMAGDMNTTIREARRLAGILDADTASRIAWIQVIHAAPYMAYAQFAAPPVILAQPAPDPRLPYVAGIRHYARAVAHAQRRDRRRFDQEIGALAAIRTGGNFEAMIAQGVPGPDLLLLAETVARARLAASMRGYDEAARLYRQAIEIEDRIPYMEPPYWYYPIRQSLGAVLYRAGRYEEARTVFGEALLRSPANGWVLYGLAQTERALGHQIEAAATDQALQRAWLGDRRWLRMDRL